MVVHRVMEEIEEVVGDKTTLDADDVDKLTYMNQVSLSHGHHKQTKHHVLNF